MIGNALLTTGAHAISIELTDGINAVVFDAS